MSLLGGLGNWLRKELDNAGSLVTGQPAHAPAPQAPPPPQFHPPTPQPSGVSIQNHLPQPSFASMYSPASAPGATQPHPQVDLKTLQHQAMAGLIPKQTFYNALNRANPSHAGFLQKYSPGNIAGGIKEGAEQTIKQNIIQPAANTVKLPADAIVSQASQLSHNPYVRQAGRDQFSEHATDSFIGPLASLANIAGTNIAANKMLNNPNTSPEVKSAQLNEAVNPSYNTQGFDLRDHGIRLGLKEANLLAQAASTPLFMGKMPEGSAAGIGAKASGVIKIADNKPTAIIAKHDQTWSDLNNRVSYAQERASNAPTVKERNQFKQAAVQLQQARDARFNEIKQGLGVGRLGLSTKDVSGDTIPAAKPNVPEVPRSENAIRADISANLDALKQATGKTPADFMSLKKQGEGYQMRSDTPAVAKPFLQRHQELQREFTQPTQGDVIPKKIDIVRHNQNQQIKIASVPEADILNGKDLGNGKRGSGIDTIMSNSTGKSEATMAADRIASQRKIDAERQALEHLKSGGTRDEAVKIYQNATGASEKMAKFRIQKIAKQAEQSLNVSKASENPLLEQFKLDKPKAGEYEKIPSNRRAVVNSIEHVEKRSLSFENKLSPADRANMDDFVQGTRDISTADNPELVRQAVAEINRATDTVHAIGENYGNTKHIDQFFPGYWDREDPATMEMERLKAEQDLEEQYGTQEWNGMSDDEKAKAMEDYFQQPFGGSEDANYAGFHSKGKTFKNNAEGRAAGFKPMFDNPYDALRRYFAGAKLQLGNQAIIQGLKEAEPIKVGQQYSIDLPGASPVSVNKEGLKILKNEGVREPINIVQKGLRSTSRTIVKTIVAFPLPHGLNQELNATFSAAFNMPGFKGKNMMGIIRNQMELASKPEVYDKWRSDFYKHGGFSPDYGKEQYGFIARGLEKAGVNPKHAELSPRAMASIEENIRVATYKAGREAGMSGEQAIKAVDNALGDSKLLGDMASSFGLFLHYFVTNAKIFGRAGVAASKGNLAPIIGIAAAYGAYMAANKAWQEISGNPNASVRAPGFVGSGIQIVRSPRQIQRGQVPSVITSHTNPLIRLGVEQATNRDLSKPVVGPEAANNTISGDRLGQSVKDVFGPGMTIQRTQSGKTSPAEAVAGNILGLYAPHASGSQASSKIKILNTPNAKPGNGLASQTAYFQAKDNAIKSLGNSQKDVDTFNAVLGHEHDADGNTISSSPRQRIADARTLYANDSVRSAMQQFEQSQPNHDPKWDLSPDQLKTFENYQGMFTGDADRIGLEFNNPWLAPFIKQRAEGFDNSQTGNSKTINNPENVAYPNVDSATQSKLDEITQMTNDPRGLSQAGLDHLHQLESDTSVQAAYKSFDKYTNDMRSAEGAPKYKPSPEADEQTQAFMNAYNAADKANRQSMRSAYPSAYVSMIKYYDQLDLHTIDKQVANTEFAGQPDATSKELKAIQAVSQDIVQDPLTGQYSVLPAAWMSNAVQSGKVSSKSSGSKSKKKPLFFRKNPRKIYITKPHKSHKVHLNTPPSPVRIKNKANKHIGIKSKSYL